jgi:hypothetical protein
MSKQDYKNQKFSIGVTVFSFVVMLAFLIYANNNAGSSLEYGHLQNALKDRGQTLKTFLSSPMQTADDKNHVN